MERMRLVAAAAACLLPAVACAAGSNVLIEVTAPALASVPAAGDAWAGPPLGEWLPGVSVLSQGFSNPQADLSIRGHPFSDSGLALAGLALRNPQTEHLQADLPLPPGLLARPVLLTGLDRFRLAAGPPAGSVALDLAPFADADRIETGAGQDGLRFGRLTLNAGPEPLGRGSLGLSAFGAWDEADRTDGQPDNDLKRWVGGGRAQYGGDGAQADFLAVGSGRRFGARGFYGASPRFPAEETVRDLLVFGGVKAERDPGRRARASLAWRRTEDEYLLDRSRRDLYANRHVSDSAALHTDARHAPGAAFALDARADIIWEHIDSRHTGSIPAAGLGEHERSRAALALLPSRAIGPVRATAGGAVEVFTEDAPAWLPAAGVEWETAAGHTLALSYTEAVQEPSYTALGYESPDSLGNRGLRRQHARAVEAGWRLARPSVDCRANVFADDGRNVVDWARSAPGARWVAVNLDRVRTLGATAEATAPLGRRADFTVSGMWLRKSCDAEPYASRYALDYPELQARLRVQARVSARWTIRAWQDAARYAENPARAGGDWALNARAEAAWAVPRLRGLTLAAGADNLWDDDFETLPGQPRGGRRAYASVALDW